MKSATRVSDQALTELCQKLSSEIFQNAPLTYELTDDRFEPRRIFSYPSQAVQ